MTCRWIAMLLTLTCTACPPDPTEEETCPDSVIFVADPSGTIAHVHRRGQIKLLERHYADGTAPTTVVGAKFGDFTLSTAESQGGLPMSDACVGLSGQPVLSDKHCEYTTTACEDNAGCASGVECRMYDRLDVAAVRVEGLSGGNIELDHQGIGTFTKAGLNQLFGDSPVDIFVTAATGTAGHNFVGNDGSLVDIPAPRFVNVTTPNISGAVPIGREDLILKWETGGNPDELVYIDLIATQTSTISAGQTRNVGISCVALDQPVLDGKACQTLWGGALTWLMKAEDGWVIGDEVKIIVGRRSAMNVDLSADTADTGLTAELTAEVQGKMTP